MKHKDVTLTWNPGHASVYYKGNFSSEISLKKAQVVALQTTMDRGSRPTERSGKWDRMMIA